MLVTSGDNSFAVRDFEMFSSDSTPRNILKCSGELYRTRLDETAVDDTGSEMRVRHNEECSRWRKVFMRVRDEMLRCAI